MYPVSAPMTRLSQIVKPAMDTEIHTKKFDATKLVKNRETLRRSLQSSFFHVSLFYVGNSITGY